MFDIDYSRHDISCAKAIIIHFLYIFEYYFTGFFAIKMLARSTHDAMSPPLILPNGRQAGRPGRRPASRLHKIDDDEERAT